MGRRILERLGWAHAAPRRPFKGLAVRPSPCMCRATRLGNGTSWDHSLPAPLHREQGLLNEPISRRASAQCALTADG